ncbi:MAG: DUF6495 family protein [Saprospiraceae bacterium]|nr:DUF6495 family protein [Saprospiraceae bacterium]
MKYRRLAADELQELETEFVQFLSSNTITGPDWEALKREKPERAEELIELFSDIVFEKVLEKIEYLEISTPKDIRTFHCEQDRIRMNGIRVEGETSLDLTQAKDAQSMIIEARESGATLKAYSGEKGYTPGRSEELFRMIQQGALISRDGNLFKTLEALKPPPAQ